MNKLQQANLAIQANMLASDQFQKLLEFLAGQAPAIEVSAPTAGICQTRVSILGRPYIIERRLTKSADGSYQTKVDLMRQERDLTFTTCHSIFIDPLGNFSIGSGAGSMMKHLNLPNDLRAVAADYILVEADHV